LRFAARSCSCRSTVQQFVAKSSGPKKAFATSSRRLKRIRVEDVMAKLENSNSSAAKEVVALGKEIDDLAAVDEEDALWQSMKQKHRSQFPPQGPPSRPRKPKQTFMNMGDPDPWEYDDILEDEDDDISALGHGELEQHREMRHYARLAAWEMPLLSKLAKPFQPPSADMPLRFRYTYYMGEQHPAEKKVVLEFSPVDMSNLTETQRAKLRKLAGVRYNPESDIVKISCEMFETQAQNKRYLGDVVASLLAEARDATDTFEDVPLDTRHHHFKPKPRFPEEWLMTDKRRAKLEHYRREAAIEDQQREIAGQIIDGIKQIEDGLSRPVAGKDARLHELIMAGNVSKPKSKGRVVGMRR